jgi:hypothetical protein
MAVVGGERKPWLVLAERVGLELQKSPFDQRLTLVRPEHLLGVERAVVGQQIAGDLELDQVG